MVELEDPSVAANARRAWCLDEEVKIDMGELASALRERRMGISGSGAAGASSQTLACRLGALEKMAPDQQARESELLPCMWSTNMVEALCKPEFSGVLKKGRRRWAQAIGLAGGFNLKNPEQGFDQACEIAVRWLAAFHPDFSNSRPDNSAEIVVATRRELSSVSIASLIRFGEEMRVDNAFERAVAVCRAVSATAATDFVVSKTSRLGDPAVALRLEAWMEGEWIGLAAGPAQKSGARGPRL